MACTDAERAKKLISIAHPDDRYQLERESAAMDIKINHWMFTICPDRRYPTTDDLKEHKYGYMDPLVIPNVISKIND
jgi:acyl-CoA hydrolase